MIRGRGRRSCGGSWKGFPAADGRNKGHWSDGADGFGECEANAHGEDANRAKENGWSSNNSLFTEADT